MKQNGYSLLLILFITAWAFTGTQSISAQDCTPTTDYLFLEEYQINKIEPELPPELHIDNAPLSKRGYLELSNQGNQPAYLVPRSEYPAIITESSSTGDIEGLAEDDLSSEIILLPEEVPEHASLIIEENSSFELNIQNIPSLVDNRFKDHNIITGSRGSFIVVPPPQRTEFYLVYAEQLYEITFTITYKMNTVFEGVTCEDQTNLVPTQVVQLEAGTPSEQSIAYWVLGTLVVIFLAIFLTLGWRLYSQRRDL